MSLALEWKGHECQAGGAEGRRREGDARAAAQRLRAHRERSQRNRTVFACFVVVSTAISALLILSVFLQVMVAQNELKTREVERQVELERRRQEGMRVEIAGLESPARIEQMAIGNLKMVQVAQAEYLETPAYQAARAGGGEGSNGGEEMVSEAMQRGAVEDNTAGH